MSKLIDVTGQKFGKWTVIERAGYNKNRAAWLCECACEKKTRKIISGVELRNGKAKSCGCHILDKLDIKLIGKTFTRLTVLCRAFASEFFICRCQCGNISKVRAQNLYSGDAKSCGCLNKELYKQYRRGQGVAEDLSGKTFGYWTVIKKSNYKHGNIFYWLCRCVCGMERTVAGNNLYSGDSKSCGCRQKKERRELAKDLTGKRYGNWLVIERDKAVFNKWIAQCQCPNKTTSSIAAYDLISNKSTSCGCKFHPISLWEREVTDYIISLLGENAILKHKRFGRLQPDIIIPNKKLIIECNGVYWHSDIVGSALNKWRHWQRGKTFAFYGYRTIFLWQDDWQQKQSAIKSYLKNLLVPEKMLIWNARSLTVWTLSNNIASRFMNDYHPQGAVNGKIVWLGLYDKNILAACMGFALSSRPILGKQHTAELIRYASLGRVRGGASRLLKHFIRLYPNIKQIVSFSDNDYFTGDMYSTTGFNLDKELPPDYTTIWGDQRRHKSFTKRRNLIKLAQQGLLIFDPNTMSEMSCLAYNNIKIAWNSGRKRWIFNVDN